MAGPVRISVRIKGAVSGTEQHANTNIRVGSFVGTGDKRREGKVIKIKVENRFMHTERGCRFQF